MTPQAKNPENRLVLDWTKAHDVCPLEKALSDLTPALTHARRELSQGTGAGNLFLGWMSHVTTQAPEELSTFQGFAEKVRNHSDAVVVIGIGGSLLGAKGVYEALTHNFALARPQAFSRHPLLFWAGHHLATDELVELLDVLDGFTPSLVVISKSGTTTETALGLRVLRHYMEQRFGKTESNRRIFAITDPQQGTLLKLAKENNWATFSIPPNVGGRFSVFTAPGLLPLTLAGIDTSQFLRGAQMAQQDAFQENNGSMETNLTMCYAGIRNALYTQGYKIESLCVWSPKLRGLAEWWKQLFGESDGKNHTGLFPASVQFSTDLHSMGQYFQEGERHIFATHIRILQDAPLNSSLVERGLILPKGPHNDGFDFLGGWPLSGVQKQAALGTFLAHSDGKIPTLVWEWPRLDAYWMGYWMFTNMAACGLGGYARGINPFDQPGVESYKSNMFALLGKPGTTEKASEIRSRLERTHRLRSLGMSTPPAPHQGS